MSRSRSWQISESNFSSGSKNKSRMRPSTNIYRQLQLQAFRSGAAWFSLSWLYIYRFSCFDMFAHYFVNYFMRLRTNHYTFLTSLILREIWRMQEQCSSLTFCENTDRLARTAKSEMREMIARKFTKCHLYPSHFSHFANIFSHSRQSDDKCIAGFRAGSEGSWLNATSEPTFQLQSVPDLLGFFVEKMCLFLSE